MQLDGFVVHGSAVGEGVGELPTIIVLVFTCVCTFVPQLALPVVAELLVTIPLFCPATELLPVLQFVVVSMRTVPELVIVISPCDMPTKKCDTTKNSTITILTGKTFLYIQTRRAEAVREMYHCTKTKSSGILQKNTL